MKPGSGQPTSRRGGPLALAVMLATAAGAALAMAFPDSTVLHLVVPGVLAAGLLLVLLARRHATSRRGAGSPRSGGQLISRKRLLFTGQQLLDRCRAKRQPLSVAVVEVFDLAELRQLFGHQIADATMGRLGGKLQAIAGARGLAARVAPGRFAVLLPGRSGEEALAALHGGIGRAGCLEHESEDDELVVLPEFKVDTIAADQRSLVAVYDGLCQALKALRPLPPGSAPVPLESDDPPDPVYVRTLPAPLQAQ